MTITYALQQIIHLRPTQEIQAVINVAPGTYNENLSISADNITIRKPHGIAGDVVVDGAGSDAITINGAHGVAITHVTIQNADDGIVGRNGATFEVGDSIVQTSDNAGIRIADNSTALLEECSVVGSGNDGIQVVRNSTATLKGNMSSNDNGRDGLFLGHSSSVYFYEATFGTNDNERRGITAVNNCSIISIDSTITAQDNVRDGIGIIGSSSLELLDEEILTLEGNRKGLFVFGTSFVWAMRNTEIEIKDNTAQGLYVAQNASIDATCDLTIENNVDMGIFMNNSAHVDIESPAVVTVTGTTSTTGMGHGIWVSNGSILNAPSGLLTVNGNTSDGIQVTRGSNIRLGSSATIQDNDRDGVSINRNSSAEFRGGTQILDNDRRGVYADDGSIVDSDGSTITGNAPDVYLRFGSRATLNNNTIVDPLDCDTTVLSRGNIAAHLCPTPP
jgi:hypothetical protein